jgi:DNA processing protein
VDSVAHVAALDAGAKTVAVLGCGVDRVYPPESGALMQRIMQNGMVLSEYPPGTPPLPWHFPQRNRIISGLSSGVLVTEAGEGSGSLSTARLAVEQGKDVYVVPGNVNYEHSVGANRFVNEGGRVVTNALDILSEHYADKADAMSRNVLARERAAEAREATGAGAEKVMYKTLTEEEKSIMKALTNGKLHVDALGRAAKLETARLNAVLVLMEMNGLVARLPGGHYTIV